MNENRNAMRDGLCHDNQQFSRSLIGGKCDDEISTRVPFELRQQVRQEAYRLGMSESQFVRDLLTIRMHGMDHYRSVMAAQTAGVVGLLQVGPANVPQTQGGAT